MKTQPREQQDPEYLAALERGLAVLRAFGADRPEMSLSEVAAAVRLSPAVVRRCLNTLVRLGYVAQRGRRFLLRPEVLRFGSGYLASINIDKIALPSLQALRDETGDSASLAVLSGHDVLYLAHASTSRQARLTASVGTRFPAHATALGRILLAFRAGDEIAAFMDSAPLNMLTEHTVTSKADMEELLLKARADGYASARDELDYGIVSVAVAVKGPDGRAAAAINCSTVTSRIGRDDLIRTRLPLLRRAASEIETALAQWPFLVHSVEQARPG